MLSIMPRGVNRKLHAFCVILKLDTISFRFIVITVSCLTQWHKRLVGRAKSLLLRSNCAVIDDLLTNEFTKLNKDAQNLQINVNCGGLI